jgi:hypothetical protein
LDGGEKLSIIDHIIGNSGNAALAVTSYVLDWHYNSGLGKFTSNALNNASNTSAYMDYNRESTPVPDRVAEIQYKKEDARTKIEMVDGYLNFTDKVQTLQGAAFTGALGIQGPKIPSNKSQFSAPASKSSSNNITVKNTNTQNGPEFVNYSTSISEGKVNVNGRAVTSGTFDYVVTNDGKLVIGTGHYNLSGGASSVQAAGQMKIFKGNVTSINNSSGHYLPSMEQGANSAGVLKNIGVDVSKTTNRLYNSSGVLEKTIKPN